MDFDMLGSIDNEQKLAIFEALEPDDFQRLDALFQPFQATEEKALKKPNFAQFSNMKLARENGYMYLPIEKLLTEKKLQKKLLSIYIFYKTFSEGKKHDAQDMLIALLMNKGTVGEFKMKSDFHAGTVHKTFIVIKNVIMVKEHQPGEFLTKECKNTIKQNFAYSLEHKVELLEEQKKQNMELLEMTRNDPLLLKEVTHPVLAYFLEKKHKQALKEMEGKLLDILNTTAKDLKKKEKEQLVFENNKKTVEQHKLDTHKKHLQDCYTKALESGLPTRNKRSNARAKIYRVIKRKLKNIQETIALLKEFEVSRIITSVILTKMSDMQLNCVGNNTIPGNYKKMSAGLSMYFISEQVKISEEREKQRLEKETIINTQKRVNSELKATVFLCSTMSTELGMPSYDNIYEEKLRKSRRDIVGNMLQSHLKDQRIRKMRKSLEVVQVVESQYSNRSRLGSSASEETELPELLQSMKYNHSSVSCNTGMTQWYGFNLNDRLYTAMEVLGINKHVMYLPYNLDTAEIIEDSIGKLSIFFKSKNYIYFSNNIKKVENILSDKQRDCLIDFFKDGNKAIKWFSTFCRNFNRVEILKQSVNFSFSSNNNFHKAIFKFLEKHKNFETL
jgi:hypothetical protein